IPASRQATGVGLPCAIDTSIWRSSVTICSALNLFFGMTSSFPSYSLTTLGLKKPGQVNDQQSADAEHAADAERSAVSAEPAADDPADEPIADRANGIANGSGWVAGIVQGPKCVSVCPTSPRRTTLFRPFPKALVPPEAPCARPLLPRNVRTESNAGTS